MGETTLIALALVVLAWAVLSEWLAARNLTGPLVMLVAGLVLANPDWGLVSVDIEGSVVHHLAEATLAMLLFADASGVPLAAARLDLSFTGRLLGIGLPLSILAGMGIALVMFPSLPLALAGLIAASLAPTDAALSASVIADERLPLVVRRVLNVESGLNDGIATPVVTLCIASAASILGVVGEEHESGVGALGALAIGIAVGAVVGVAGGRLLVEAHRRGWVAHFARRYASLALAGIAFLVATELDGNPFVAAFIGGLLFGTADKGEAEASVELTEMVGSLLSLVLWFVFGAGFVIPALDGLSVQMVVYALLSLTVVRMVPVALCLIRTHQDRATVAFLGWFGPRGLASVVFGLLAVEELGATDPRVKTALGTITITVVLSIVLHGLTARPLTTRFVNRSGAPDPESDPEPEGPEPIRSI